MSTKSDEGVPQPINADAEAPPTIDDVSTPVERTGPWSGAEAAGVKPAGDAPPGYEILGELGRGGMGVVYKARHRQLNRIVALKMILAGSHAGEQELARFQVEAQAVARLQHPGIVQIHEVGVYQGRPFFSLEFVAGGSLASKLKGNPWSFSRSAEVIEQLARAIQHAHEQGVIHRDLKPANVLMAADDTPRVTDFGLAKQMDADQDLSGSGAIMGTPSYMAPEQAEGRVRSVGPAADIYALGVILYELLTGQVPFRGQTVADTLDMVRKLEPVPPSRLQPKTPRDLETICLKCLHKEPSRRYATAAALADDVRRYREGLPIIARPVSNLERGWMWAKRRPTTAALVAVCVVTVVSAGIVAWNWSVQRATRLAETSLTVNDKLNHTSYLVKTASEFDPKTHLDAIETRKAWEQAEAALVAAEAALRTGTGDDRLREQVQVVRLQIEHGHRQAVRKERLFHDLDEARMKGLGGEQMLDYALAAAKYAQAFEAYEMEVKPSRIAELARQIRAEPPGMRDAMILALDDWASSAGKSENKNPDLSAKALRDIAAAADDNPWRRSYRAAVIDNNPAALHELSAEARRVDTSPSSLYLLAISLEGREENDEARGLLRWGRGRYPTDFWLHFQLGNLLRVWEEMEERRPEEIEEAIGCYRAALAVRPLAGVVHNNLGNALAAKKQFDEAITEWRKAIELDPKSALPHNNLGKALFKGQRIDEAITEYRKAIELDPKYAVAHNGLGFALEANNQLDDAIAEYNMAIGHDRKDPVAHLNLGRTLYGKNRLDDAIAEFNKAVALGPKSAIAHHYLGNALRVKNHLDDAIAEYNTSITLDSKSASAHYDLGIALQAKNQLDDAIAEYNVAIALDAKHAMAHAHLGVALQEKNRLDDAIAEYKKSIALDPKLIEVHGALGNALLAKSQLDDAIAEYKTVIALDPKSAVAHLNLGLALQAKNHLDDGIAELDKAIALEPTYANAHGALGQALLNKGRFVAAKTSTRHALELLPDIHPLRPHMLGQMDKCDLLLATEAKLPDILAGKAQPNDNREWLSCVEVCRLQHRHAAVAKLYREAFAADPTLAEDLQQQHRNSAACHAALAAAGQGIDADKLDDLERSRLRKQALDWLRADLDLWGKRLTDGKPEDRKLVQDTLRHWQDDADLAGVRDVAALQKLPAEEQAAWQKLWTDVTDLLKKAGNAK